MVTITALDALRKRVLWRSAEGNFYRQYARITFTLNGVEFSRNCTVYFDGNEIWLIMLNFKGMVMPLVECSDGTWYFDVDTEINPNKAIKNSLRVA